MPTDAMEAVGHVRITKRSVETGEIVYDEVFKNKITDFARSQVAQMWTGMTLPVPTLIAVGTGTNAAGPQSSDSALWSELSGTRQTMDYSTTFLNFYTQYSVTYDQSHAIGTVTGPNPTGQISITECGLFDSAGNLWSHVQLNGVTHDNTSTLSIQWQVLQNGN